MSGANKASLDYRRRPLAAGLVTISLVVVATAGFLVWPGPGHSDAARPGPSPTPTPTPTGGTFMPPGSIAMDCSVSVTAELQSWLATVPDNSIISFPASACYRSDAPFIVRERTGLTFEGNGATFLTVTDGTEFMVPRNRSHWRLVHSTGITIRNLIVDGPNTTGTFSPAFEAQHGFEVAGGIQVRLSNVTVREVYGDSVNVARSIGTRTEPLPQRDSEDITVENSTLENIGRQGISVTSGRRVTLRGNTLTGAGRSAIDLEPTGTNNVIEDIVIDSNNLSGYGNYMVAAGGACTTTFRNITIIGNTATGAGPRVGNGCADRQNLLVQSNTLIVPVFGGNQAILIVNFSGAVVRSNSVLVSQSIPGVSFQASSGLLLVELNQFCGASEVYSADAATGPVTELGNTLLC